MSYKYIINIKGISAAGKSSRLHVLIAYLGSKGLTLEDFIRPDYKGKDQSYGTLIKELNLVVLGKNYEKDGVLRFQGFDAVTGRQSKSHEWSQFIIDQVKEGYSFIVEGAGITNSNRYRPEFLFKEIPDLSLVANYYYNFEPEEKQAYLDRVKYRSGKVPKKDSMWDNGPGIYRDYEKSLEEAASKVPEGKRCVASYDSWKEPIWHFGFKFFTDIFAAPDKLPEFQKFCEEYDYVNTNKYSGPPLEEPDTAIDPNCNCNLDDGDCTCPPKTGKQLDLIKDSEKLHPGNQPKNTEEATKRSKGEDYMTTSGQMYRFEEEKKKAEFRERQAKTLEKKHKEAFNQPENFGMSVDMTMDEESFSVKTEINGEGAIIVHPPEEKDMCDNCGTQPYNKNGDCTYCGHKKSKSVSLEFSGDSKRNNPKDEFSIFPKQTMDRSEMKWEDHLFDLTPVEKVGKMWFKREDRFAPLGYGGLNGSKLRQCIWMIGNFPKSENSMVISGASVKSPQLPMGTAVARHFGMESVHIVGATNPRSSIKRDMVEMATWLGAKFQYEPVGYNPYLQKATRELYESRGKVDYYLNYGITPPDDATDEYIHGFHAVGAFQTQNIPPNIEKIVVPTGSTNSAISILYGLSKFRDKFTNLKDVYLIGIGPDKMKMVEHRLNIIKKLSGVNTKNFNLQWDAKHLTSSPENNALNLHYINIQVEGYTDYQSEKKFCYEGIEFHPTYEGKVMSYLSEKMPEVLTENTMLWIVGSKPRMSDMTHMNKVLGEVPTEAIVYQDNTSTLKKEKPNKKEEPKKEVITEVKEETYSIETNAALDKFFSEVKGEYEKGTNVSISFSKSNEDNLVIYKVAIEKSNDEEPSPDKLIASDKEDSNIKSITIDVDNTCDAEPVGTEESDKPEKIPFDEPAPHIPVGRVEGELRDLDGITDFKDPKVRRELFLDFYEFHLKYKAHPGAVYYAFPYMFEKLGLTLEQKLWFVFINGCTQNVVTTWMIFKNFPNIEEITFDSFEEWHRANWRKLHYDIDRRYQKGHMVEMWQNYMENLDGKTQVEFFSALAGTGNPEENFWNVWNKVITDFKWYGRLSTYSYLEYLKIVGLDINCPSLFLYEKEGSKSPRNGLCKVLGRDDLDWHKSNPTFGGYGEDVLKWLEEESHVLLNEAKERFKDKPFAPDVNFFTLESTLCCFKSWFRKNRRYPNVYNDMFYDRIVKMEEEDWGENDLSMFWDMRAKNLPEHLRMEDNPDDLGIHPFKQNWFRETGEVIMMDKDFPIYKNTYEEARSKKPKLVRRNVRKQPQTLTE